MKLFSFYTISFFLFQGVWLCNAQDIAIGQWRDHLSYKKAIAVAEGNGMVYCASQGGFFAFNKSDNSFQRLSKINGFSSTGVTALAFNKYNNTLVIAYKDENIDLLINNKIMNFSDIKNKAIPGNKSINGIYFNNQYAYLSCGFGIVVFDTDRQEIKDTYYIGPGGTPINVRATTTDAAFLYAATDNGVYRAALNAPNLADFSVWSKMPGLPDGIYNTIASFNGKILANLSERIATEIYNQDSIFVFNGFAWSHFSMASPYTIREIKSYNSQLFLTTEENIFILDTAYFITANMYTYVFDGINKVPHPKQLALDENNTIWIADNEYGLVKNGAEILTPNGPNTHNVYSTDWRDGNLWSVPGGVTDAWGGVFNNDGVSQFKENTWTTISGDQSIANMDTLLDIIAVAVDPQDGDHAYAGSWLSGLLEFKDGKMIQIFNESNTNGALTKQGGYLLNGGLAFDNQNNLWVSKSSTTEMLAVKKADGAWQSFEFSAFVQPSVTAAAVLVTQSGQKWALLPRGGGILVYQDKGTFADPDNLNTKKITGEEGSGALPSIDIHSFAEDLNGEIWVGTAKGVAVFYSPESIFEGNGNWDARQILIEQDGHVQILLETEAVTAIAVDGTNRKWLGTSKSGVFLMSADGTKQIHHFNESNSPLFSNQIRSISIDHKSGEVFFGTSEGIISYKGAATEGSENFQEVYAYPNPVKEDYTGTIGIKGLVKDASVKITDISGTLIYSTKAQGGQATWDGKSFNGKKARTGTYLVYCSNEDGSKTFVTKILIIN